MRTDPIVLGNAAIRIQQNWKMETIDSMGVRTGDAGVCTEEEKTLPELLKCLTEKTGSQIQRQKDEKVPSPSFRKNESDRSRRFPPVGQYRVDPTGTMVRKPQCKESRRWQFPAKIKAVCFYV